MTPRLTAAVDLGGTFLRCGWWDGEKWAATRTAPTELSSGAALVGQLVALLDDWSGPAPSGLVVASAGSLDPATGLIAQAANLPFTDLALRDILTERLGWPVAVVGDASAAAVGEFARGAAAGTSDGVFLTLSTGIGMGIVAGGALADGHGHQAGELGHIPVDLRPEAPRCTCGQTGCLELFASGSGMVARYAAPGSHPPVTDSADLIARADAGEAAAAAVVEHGAQLLGATIAGVIRVFAPDAVVLGGGLTASRSFRDRIDRALRAILERSLPQAPELVRLASCQPSPGLVGAALLGAGDRLARRLIERTGYLVQFEEFDHDT